jgi:peptidoglycan/LPS O-acetylase OafA/YrhL
MKRIDAVDRTRLDYVDNLRWAMIALVVGLHAAVTYSHIGSWYWNAPERPGPLTQMVFLVFEVHLQGFFMGFMFLLAGYFVPAAYDRKGFARFLTDRWLRLGVPSLAYMLLVHPLTGYFVLHWWDVDLPTAYAGFLRSGRWISASGPMWFAVALLIFSAVYALCRLMVGGGTGVAAPSRPGLAALAALGLVIGVIAYLVRMVWPIGTSTLNMQFCYFTQYVVLFAIGVQAYRRAWFQTLPRRLGLPLFWGALIVSPLASVAVLASLADPMGALHSITGGGTWQSALFALWESLYCVAMCAGLLVLFREKLNVGGGLFGRFTASSFGIYMMHMPVLVSVTLALQAVDWPLLAKWAVAWPTALILTFLMIEFGLRRVPGIKRFL